MSVEHICSICRKAEPWGPTWSWYGSYRDMDDGVPVLKFCSEACKEALSNVDKHLTKIQRKWCDQNPGTAPSWLRKRYKAAS